MNKAKSRWILLLSLLTALLLILGAALLPATKKAYAANTYAYNDTSFMLRPGEGGDVEASEGETKYVQLSMKNGGSVEYRRNLALKWFEEDSEATPDYTTAAGTKVPCKAGYFSMEFSVPEIAFEKLTITFSGAEENISKETKSSNALIFTKKDDNTLTVQVKNASTEKDEDMAAGKDVSKDSVKISFSEDGCVNGEFQVSVNGDALSDKFTNIGSNYLEFRSTASATPNVPVTFKTELPEGASADARQKIVMKTVNGQSFELDSSSRITDNAPAVLVLNQEVHAFRLGQRFSLSYEAIDVCDSSVSVTRYYYMLKTQKKGDPATDVYVKPADSDYKTLTTSTYFLPVNDVATANPEEYIAIRFKLSDGTTDNYSYLSWYAAESAVVIKGDDGEENYFDYIKVNNEKSGPAYVGLTVDNSNPDKLKNTASSALETAAENYQTAVTAAAEKASAGSGAYIYLPSLRGLIQSDCADYRDLKFSIYYYKESQAATSSASSQTALSYNSLKIEVNEEGWYKFRVLATDSAGNEMKYIYDGELVTVSNSNIWEIKEIPEFSFYVTYNGASIEKPKEQSLGYRNDTYSFSSFEIIALSGYKTEYNLYRINTASANIPAGQSLPAYASLVENMQNDFNKYNTQWKCMDEIQKFRSDVEEDSALWSRTDNDYHWNPDSSLSFVPQEAGFYVLEVTVKDAYRPGHEVKQYQVVEVRNPIDTIPGESQWLKNNVASVVLFSISAALAIVVVVLFLVKPSDKTVEEIDLEKLKGKKKEKKAKTK